MNKSSVFKSDDGRIFLVRCPECEEENYAMNVASGVCTWCGYKATEGDCDESAI